MTTVFLRVLEDEDKAEALQEAIQKPDEVRGQKRFKIDPESFRQMPGAPFAYWVSEALRRTFTDFSAFESGERSARQGVATADDFRFVRFWVESSINRYRWRPFAKGGVYSPYYSGIHLMVNWKKNGAEIRHFENAYIRNEEQYGRPGLTWPLRTTSGLSLRALPVGCIFGHKGPTAFVDDNDPTELLALLSITNSQAFRTLVALQMAAADAAARSYEVGIIQHTPVPELNKKDKQSLADFAHRAWSIKRRLDTAELTSNAFVLPALLQVSGETLSERATNWNKLVAGAEQDLSQIQATIDERCFNLYGFTDEDREQAIGGTVTESEEEPHEEGEETETNTVTEQDPASLAAALVDWLVGVAFGRFDVRLATGDREQPSEPDPFDPLPVCSPGMLIDEQGLPVEHTPPDYPLALPPHGLLVDDAGIDDELPPQWDIVQRIRAVLETVFGDDASAMEAELCQLLGTRDLRTYLRRATLFFKDHLTRYSKSRRKAPIYWPLATSSGSYGVWVYYPSLTADTLHSVINEHVGPKIDHTEDRLAQLEAKRAQAEGREASRLGKRVSQLTQMLEELKAFREQLQEVTALPYRPNHDDGVQISAAPLYPLLRHTPWRRELKKTWQSLSDGQYDWAHIAYAIWPERVREKCQSDKSLAIAHDLEELYTGDES